MTEETESKLFKFEKEIDMRCAAFQRRTRMTQDEMAEALGMCEATLSAKRKGWSAWRTNELAELAELLGIEFRVLFTEA